MGAGRKGGPPSGPSRPKAGIGARGGVVVLGLQFPVRQPESKLLGPWKGEQPKASHRLFQLA
jgi:hypothetical protein